MKAVQMIAEGPPDVLRYVDVDMPVPGVGQEQSGTQATHGRQHDFRHRTGSGRYLVDARRRSRGTPASKVFSKDKAVSAGPCTYSATWP